MPTLAVCHTPTGSTRAGTPCSARSVRAARPSSSIARRAGAVAVDQQHRRRARRRCGRRAAACAAVAPGRPWTGRRSEIAPLGHTVLQAPQPTHRCGSTTMPPVGLAPPCRPVGRRAPCPAACPSARRRCGSRAPSRRRCRRCSRSARCGCARRASARSGRTWASRTRPPRRAARARPCASVGDVGAGMEVALRRLVHRERRLGAQVEHQVEGVGVARRGARSKSIAPAASHTRTQSRWLVQRVEVDLVAEVDRALGADGDAGVAARAQVEVDRVAALPFGLERAEPAATAASSRPACTAQPCVLRQRAARRRRSAG